MSSGLPPLSQRQPPPPAAFHGPAWLKSSPWARPVLGGGRRSPQASLVFLLPFPPSLHPSIPASLLPSAFCPASGDTLLLTCPARRSRSSRAWYGPTWGRPAAVLRYNCSDISLVLHGSRRARGTLGGGTRTLHMRGQMWVPPNHLVNRGVPEAPCPGPRPPKLVMLF